MKHGLVDFHVYVVILGKSYYLLKCSGEQWSRKEVVDKYWEKMF